MAFQGRHDGERGREEPDPGSRRRRDSRSIRPAPCALPIETLETRVLLSTNSAFSRFIARSDLQLLHSPVVIVPMVVHPKAGGGQSMAIEGPVDLTPRMEASYSTSQAVGGVEITASVPLNLTPASFASTGINDPLSGSAEPPGSVMTLAGFSTAGLGEGSVPPIVVVAPPVMEVTGGYVPGADPAFTWISQPAPPMSGAGPGSTTSGQATGVSGGGETGVASIPVARHVQLDAALNGTQSSMSILIPIGPTTQAIGVSLHTVTAGESGDLPVVDEMLLENRDGDPIAQLGPFTGPMPGLPIRALTVALENAPVGGSLLVQVSIPTLTSSGTGAQTNTSKVVGSTLPFMMDIQRQDNTAAMSSVAGSLLLGPLSGQGLSGIGTLTNASTTDQDGNPTDQAEPSNTDPAANPQTVVVDSGNVIPPAEDQADSREEGTGSLDLGAGTGPLVSRSSGPLGPMLATLLNDPAPPVDRHERALLQAIEESGSEDDSHAPIRNRDPARFKGSPRESPSDSATMGGSDGTQLASAGVGAFPLKVTGRIGGVQTTDLDSLLLALPGSLEDMPTRAIVASDEQSAGDISVELISARESTRTDRVAPNLLTAACGLALGLGLTARPLLPDLLALLPPRFTRSRRFGKGSKSYPESHAPWTKGIGRRDREPSS